MTPYYDNGQVVYYHGVALDVLRALPAGSVDACVTSPPYHGLRRYSGVEPTVWGGNPMLCDDDAHEWVTVTTPILTGGRGAASVKQISNAGSQMDPDGSDSDTCRTCGAWRGCLGNEPTVEGYIAHIGMILAEVRRVLRDDGVCLLNIGDNYTGSGRGPGNSIGAVDQNERQGFASRGAVVPNGYKRKELSMTPFRTALALQGWATIPGDLVSAWVSDLNVAMFDGDWSAVERVTRQIEMYDALAQSLADSWYLRSVIVWHKRAPMPESVTDRPTSSWEPIFLLAKSERYYWDADAIREKYARDWMNHSEWVQGGNSDRVDGGRSPQTGHPDGRNIRNVWTLSPNPYNGTLTAAREMVALGLADFVGKGKKAYQARAECPNPRHVRHLCIERRVPTFASTEQYRRYWEAVESHCRCEPVSGDHYATYPEEIPTRAVLAGVRPGGVILDPFVGSGTTALAAIKNGRRCIGIDASQTYLDRHAIPRVRQCGLFAAPVVEPDAHIAEPVEQRQAALFGAES